MGVAASQMERKGIRTERGNQNREIEITNRQIRQLRARINKLDKWLAEEATNDKPPTLFDVLQEILSRQGCSTLTNLKHGSEIFTFLIRNEIFSIDDLEIKVRAMHSKVNAVRDDLKKTERRIDTLQEHLRHSGNFKNYRKHRQKYEGLYSEYLAAKKGTGFGSERKTKKALAAANEYHEQHRSELAMFANAEQYLRDVFQDRFDPKKLPPITKWRDELAAKLAEKDSLYREYSALKDDTYKIEQIRASVKAILHNAEPQPERTARKSRGVEL
jgi:uncharacterized coiled-coil protein SlyX